jgi:hypothetical protein
MVRSYSGPVRSNGPDLQALVGELRPLSIPDTPWDTVSVDFIVELPESSGHDTVMVVVDSVTKTAHFIPTFITVSAAGTARLFVQHVWKFYGLPRKVVSDRGPQFVAEFTRELYRMLGIKVAATTAYHPQGDRQTERVNQELEQYLCLFVNQRQDDWADLLPLAEFQYNNHVHSATQHPPFLLQTGRLPRMGFEPNQRPSNVESVNEFTEQMWNTLEEAKAALAKSKDDMSKYYNQRRTPAPEFHPGDKVYLDGTDITTARPSRKLSHKYLGPFPIERKIGNGVYRLCLPPSMSRIHPVFNIVKLTPASEDPIPGRRAVPPPPPEIVDGEEEWVVEEILDSKMMNWKLRYLVRWKDFGMEHNSWEPWDNVHAPELVAEFYKKHPGAARHIQTTEFLSIPFRPATVSGRHCSEGGGGCKGTLRFRSHLHHSRSHLCHSRSQLRHLRHSVTRLCSSAQTDHPFTFLALRHFCSSVISVRPEWTYGFLCLLLLFISAYLYLTRLSVLLIPLLIPFLAFPLLFIISTNSVVSIYIPSHLSRTLSFSLRILLLGES